MQLNNQDKTFLMKSMKNVRQVMKFFKSGLSETEVELINSLEPAIKSNDLNVFQIEFLIKNMENVYKTTPNKYIKKLIGNLNELREFKLNEQSTATESEKTEDVEQEYKMDEKALEVGK